MHVNTFDFVTYIQKLFHEFECGKIYFICDKRKKLSQQRTEKKNPRKNGLQLGLKTKL